MARPARRYSYSNAQNSSHNGSQTRRTTRRYSSGMVNSARTIGGTNNSGYVYGNAVRNESLPEYTPERERQKKEKPRRQQQVAKTVVISGASFVFISVMVLVMALNVYGYVKKNNEVSAIRKEISSLQTTNEEKRRRQSDRMTEINNNVDLAYIYKVAIKKYGMQEVDRSNVYTYNNSKSDVVKQYSDLP